MSVTMLSKVRSYLAERHALGFELKIQGYHLLNSHATRTDRAAGQTEIPSGDLLGVLTQKWGASLLGTATGHRSHLCQTPFADESQNTSAAAYVFGPASCRNPPHLYTAGQIEHLLNRATQLPGDSKLRRFKR
jgi:hypothetical protein